MQLPWGDQLHRSVARDLAAYRHHFLHMISRAYASTPILRRRMVYVSFTLNKEKCSKRLVRS